jgi:light-regulated signal transduction histidine kinase (bacteriophytochrome)
MNLPVIVNEKIVLVAGVGNKSEDYDDADVQHLALLMEGMWRLIEGKRAETEIRELNTELEQRVRNRTAQLEAANKELESFAYSISHDLRAPLRHIDGFIYLLKNKMEKSLQDQSLHYLDAITSSSKKMGVLIDGLLALSRMGRQALTFRLVDLRIVVEEIIVELTPDVGSRDVCWKIGKLPKVYADIAMIRIVLTNLLSNAIKFTRLQNQALIEIGIEPEDDSEISIFVRDNGVGFDMAYSDRLFGVFQRLHNADEFEGTGIGLATSYRIVTKHGGRIWAEGEVGQGATFYFTLPKNTQDT